MSRDEKPEGSLGYPQACRRFGEGEKGRSRPGKDELVLHGVRLIILPAG